MKFSVCKSLLRAAVAGFGLAVSCAAQAQGYPTKPVRVIIPFSPGGAADVPGRILMTRLSEAFGQQFLVDNRPGAGSTIGAEIVSKSPADGYTLLLISNTHVISAALYKTLKYDASDDFTPIAEFGDAPNVLVVHPSLPVKTVKELIALAKAKPGQIDYASSGNGSSQHLFMALFANMAGISMNHVPYKGSGQARADLLGGQIMVGMPGISSVVQNIKEGRLRALGVTGAKRSAELPNVPTIAEAGVKGYEASLWLGLLGPKGLPKEVVARLNDEIARLARDAAFQEQLRKTGTDVVYRGPEQWAAFLKSERAKWAKVVRDTGVQVN
ncbi:MAG: Bug family tripartite tricarboxylate transporter substrate binding protein [Burkholderiales bacterium]